MVSTKTRDVGTSSLIGGSIREDLAGYISNISRDETPFISSIGTNKAKSQRHDWQTDTLMDPVDNRQASDFDFNTANAVNDVPNRLSNYTQIFGKTIHVSGSLIKSDFAGAEDYFVYQMKKRKREIMRDIETAALAYSNVTGTSNANTQVITYTNADNGRVGSVFAYTANWLTTNGTPQIFGDSGAGTAITGYGGINTGFNISEQVGGNFGQRTVHLTAAPTTQAVTADHFNEIARITFDNGGMLKRAQVPTSLKADVSDAFIAGNAGAAQRRADSMATKVTTYVDVIMLEFGMSVALMPNYIMQNYNNAASIGNSGVPNTVFLYDPSMIKRSVLTPLTSEEDGTARYGKGYIMFCEETLEIMNPNSLAAVTALA